MTRQVMRKQVRLGAILAGINAFAGMRNQMTRQFAGGHKASTAILAREWQIRIVYDLKKNKDMSHTYIPIFR